MTDFLGPASAPNAVTIRPGDGRSFPALDTWFKDCTSPTTQDGTDLQAAFLNGAIAALRSSVRMNGTRNDGITPIVTENGADDDLITKAIKHLVQRGLPMYAVAAGTANALIVSLSPTLIEYRAGLALRVKIVTANAAGGVTINVDGQGVKSILHPDGTALGASELPAGMVAFLVYDGFNFQLVGGQVAASSSGAYILTAPRSFYVDNVSGNDSNDGGAAGAGRAFKTMQKAIDTIALYNLNGYDVTVYVADSVSNPPWVSKRLSGSGLCHVIGNPTSPQNCMFVGSNQAAIKIANPGYDLNGVGTTYSGPANPGAGVWSVKADCTLKNMYYGSVVHGHVVADGSYVILAGSQTIGGGGQFAWYAVGSGYIRTDVSPNLPSLTLIGTPNFSFSFTFAQNLGTVLQQWSSIAGAAAGTRYAAFGNAVIDVQGAGPSYLPGSAVGYTSTGGQYV